jgi:hypothetical protein
MMKELKKYKYLTQDRRYSNGDSNRKVHEYKSEAIPPEPPVLPNIEEAYLAP